MTWRRPTPGTNDPALLLKLDEISVRLDRLERLSQGGRAAYLGDRKLLVRCDWSHLRTVYTVDANDQLIVPNLMADGVYEPLVTDFIVRSLGRDSHCLDIGANFGYYTCIMAKIAHAGRTIGVEADPVTFEFLRRNIHINWCEAACSVENVAIADRVGELALYRRPERSGNTSLSAPDPAFLQHMGEGPVQPFTVVSAPLDSFLERLSGRVDLVKIDIEGAEPLAFLGVSETVRRNPGIKFVMEWSPGQVMGAGFDVRDFTASIAALGLSAWTIEPGGVTAISFEDLIATPYLSGVLLAMQV